MKNSVKNGLLVFFMLAMFANVVLSIYIYAAKLLGEQGISSGGSCFAADIGDCLKVQLSSYASIFGIPLSIYGAVFFFVVFVLLLGLFFESRTHSISRLVKDYSKSIRISLVLLYIWGGAFSLWLMGLQFFIIGELCKFCLWVDSITLGSAIIFLWVFSRGMLE